MLFERLGMYQMQLCSSNLNIPTLKQEVIRFSERYVLKLQNLSNNIAMNLLDSPNSVNTLQRPNILDLQFV